MEILLWRDILLAGSYTAVTIQRMFSREASHYERLYSLDVLKVRIEGRIIIVGHFPGLSREHNHDKRRKIRSWGYQRYQELPN